MTDSSEQEPREDNPAIDVSDPAIVAQYEPYLRMLARTHMRRAYQAKVGASDMVQQAMLQAVQGLDGFRGSTEAEFRGWLRQILAHHLCHLDRDLHRDKRDIRREQSTEQKLAQSSMRLEALLAGEGPTPSQNVALGEHVIQVAQAVQRLPEPQREAVRLHYLEGMKLSEVAAELDKSTGAIAGLLHRGMKTLRNSSRATKASRDFFFTASVACQNWPPSPNARRPQEWRPQEWRPQEWRPQEWRPQEWRSQEWRSQELWILIEMTRRAWHPCC